MHREFVTPTTEINANTGCGYFGFNVSRELKGTTYNSPYVHMLLVKYRIKAVH